MYLSVIQEVAEGNNSVQKLALSTIKQKTQLYLLGLQYLLLTQ